MMIAKYQFKRLKLFRIIMRDQLSLNKQIQHNEKHRLRRLYNDETYQTDKLMVLEVSIE